MRYRSVLTVLPLLDKHRLAKYFLSILTDYILALFVILRPTALCLFVFKIKLN